MSTREGYISMNTEEGLDLKVPSASTTTFEFGKTSSENWKNDEYVSNISRDRNGYTFEDLRPYIRGECFSVVMGFSVRNSITNIYTQNVINVKDINGDSVFNMFLRKTSTSISTGANHVYYNGTYTSSTKNITTNISVSPEGVTNLFVFRFYKQSIRIDKACLLIDSNTGEYTLDNQIYPSTEEITCVENKDDVNILKLFNSLDLLEFGGTLSLLKFYDKDVLAVTSIGDLGRDLIPSLGMIYGLDALFTVPSKDSSFFSTGNGVKEHVVNTRINRPSGSELKIKYTKGNNDVVSFVEGRDIHGEPVNVMRVKQDIFYNVSEFPYIDVDFGTNKHIQIVIGYYKDNRFGNTWSNVLTLTDSSNTPILEIMESSNKYNIKVKSNTSSKSFDSEIMKDLYRPTVITITDKIIAIEHGINFSKVIDGVCDPSAGTYYNLNNKDIMTHTESFDICNNARKIILGHNFTNAADDGQTDYVYLAYRSYTPTSDLSQDGFSYSNKLFKDAFDRFNNAGNIELIRKMVKDDFGLCQIEPVSPTPTPRLALFAPNTTSVTSETGWKSNVDGFKMYINSNGKITNEQLDNGKYSPVIISKYNNISSNSGTYLELSNIRKGKGSSKVLLLVIKFKLKDHTNIVDGKFKLFTLTSKIGSKRDIFHLYYDNITENTYGGTGNIFCNKYDGYDVLTGSYEGNYCESLSSHIPDGQFHTMRLKITKNGIGYNMLEDNVFWDTSSDNYEFIPINLEGNLCSKNKDRASKSLHWLLDKIGFGDFTPGRSDSSADPKMQIEFIDIYDRELTQAEKSEYLAGRIPNDPNVQLTPKSSFPTDQNQITGITNGNIVNTSGVGFTDPLAPYPNENKETAFISTMDGINTETSRFTGNSILYVNYSSQHCNHSSYSNAIKNWFKDKYIFSALPPGNYTSQERSGPNAISVQCRINVLQSRDKYFGDQDGLIYYQYADRMPIELPGTYGILWAEKDVKYKHKVRDNHYIDGDNTCYGYIEYNLYNLLESTSFNAGSLTASPDEEWRYMLGNYVSGLDVIDFLCGTSGASWNCPYLLRVDFKIKTWIKDYQTDGVVTGEDSRIAEQNIALLFVNNFNNISNYNYTLSDFLEKMNDDTYLLPLTPLTTDKVNEWFNTCYGEFTPQLPLLRETDVTPITTGNIVNLESTCTSLGFTKPLTPFIDKNKESAFISKDNNISAETMFTDNVILYLNQYIQSWDNNSDYINAIYNWFTDKYFFINPTETIRAVIVNSTDLGFTIRCRGSYVGGWNRDYGTNDYIFTVGSNLGASKNGIEEGYNLLYVEKTATLVSIASEILSTGGFTSSSNNMYIKSKIKISEMMDICNFKDTMARFIGGAFSSTPFELVILDFYIDLCRYNNLTDSISEIIPNTTKNIKIAFVQGNTNDSNTNLSLDLLRKFMIADFKDKYLSWSGSFNDLNTDIINQWLGVGGGSSSGTIVEDVPSTVDNDINTYYAKGNRLYVTPLTSDFIQQVRSSGPGIIRPQDTSNNKERMRLYYAKLDSSAGYVSSSAITNNSVIKYATGRIPTISDLSTFIKNGLCSNNYSDFNLILRAYDDDNMNNGYYNNIPNFTSYRPTGTLKLSVFKTDDRTVVFNEGVSFYGTDGSNTLFDELICYLGNIVNTTNNENIGSIITKDQFMTFEEQNQLTYNLINNPVDLTWDYPGTDPYDGSERLNNKLNEVIASNGLNSSNTILIFDILVAYFDTVNYYNPTWSAGIIRETYTSRGAQSEPDLPPTPIPYYGGAIKTLRFYLMSNDCDASNLEFAPQYFDVKDINSKGSYLPFEASDLLNLKKI